jgi:hypothetical protein
MVREGALSSLRDLIGFVGRRPGHKWPGYSQRRGPAEKATPGPRAGKLTARALTLFAIENSPAL